MRHRRRVLAGAVVGVVVAAVGGASAGEKCVQAEMTSPQGEARVVITVNPQDGRGMEVVVTGAAGGAVKVEAPAGYAVTATGASGLPGAAGKSAQ